MKKIYRVCVQRVIDHRVYVIADSEEEAINRTFEVGGRVCFDLLLKGRCATSEFLIPDIQESTQEEYMNDSDDILLIKEDSKLYEMEQRD